MRLLPWAAIPTGAIILMCTACCNFIRHQRHPENSRVFRAAAPQEMEELNPTLPLREKILSAQGMALVLPLCLTHHSIIMWPQAEGMLLTEEHPWHRLLLRAPLLCTSKKTPGTTTCK